MSQKSICMFVCAVLAGCASHSNTGLSGIHWTSMHSSGDPGVHNGYDVQSNIDGSPRLREAIFRSSHPGGSEDGFGTTEWVYVRAVDLNYARVLAGDYNITPEVVRFFRDCAPSLDPTAPADAFRSGRIAESDSARMVLTRLTWRTEIGPGPLRFQAARISRSALEVFGTTAALRRPPTVKVTVSVASGNSFGSPGPVLERELSGLDLSDIRANCQTQVLETNPISLGGTGWFPRGDVNNLGVEIVEQ